MLQNWAIVVNSFSVLGQLYVAGMLGWDPVRVILMVFMLAVLGVQFWVAWLRAPKK